MLQLIAYIVTSPFLLFLIINRLTPAFACSLILDTLCLLYVFSLGLLWGARFLTCMVGQAGHNDCPTFSLGWLAYFQTLSVVPGFCIYYSESLSYTNPRLLKVWIHFVLLPMLSLSSFWNVSSNQAVNKLGSFLLYDLITLLRFFHISNVT